MKVFMPVYFTLGGVATLLVNYLCTRINLIRSLLISISPALLPIGIVLIIVGGLSLAFFIKRAGWHNYFYSLTDTLDLRSYLKQQATVNDFTGDKRQDLVKSYYNSSLIETYIEYRKDNATVKLCIPNNVEAKKKLDGYLTDAKQKVQNMVKAKSYIWSNWTQDGDYYVMTGMPRQP